MSRSYTDNEIVSLNYHGHEVRVYFEYLVDIDSNYGADADGHRGVYREEVIVNDRYIESPKDATFTKEQVDEILSAAEDRLFAHHGWRDS